MQLAPSASGLARTIVQIGPCAHWSELNGLLERLRAFPQLAALEVAGLQDGVITLSVTCPATLPLERLLTGALPSGCSLSVRAAAENPAVGSAANDNGSGGTGAGTPPVAHTEEPHAGALDWPRAPVENGHAGGTARHNGTGGTHDDPRDADVDRGPTSADARAPADPPRPRAAPAPSGGVVTPEHRGTAPAVGRILIALDGSRRAEEALAYVAAHFEAARTEVHLLSVLEGAEATAMRDAIEQSPAASYRRLYLRACAQDLHGFQVRCVVAAHAAPADAILDYVARTRLALVVMTAHGHSRTAAAPIGSVAASVIGRHHIPVLLLPGLARP